MNKDKLYRETLKLAKETNKRLARLEKGVDINKGKYNPKTKRFERKESIQIINKKGKKINLKTVKRVKYPKGTWASKKLMDKLDTYMNGKLQVTRSMSTSELTVLNKALRNFLNSKTSTIQGIQDIERQTKQNISNLIVDVDTPELETEDIETLYNFFEDSDFRDVTEYIPPSDLYIILNESKQAGDNPKMFMSKIERYIDKDSLNSDSDMKNKLTRIYTKFIK